MSLRTAAQQALEALVQIRTPLRINTALDAYDVSRAIAALRDALAEPEQESVAHLWQHCETGRTRVVMPEQIITADANWFVVGPLYLHPPQRKPLTDEELKFIADQYGSVFGGWEISFARAIERAHGIGGEA